ncbi:MAG TPA: DUF2007 domain-containing protein [Bacillota bacterium]|nr:DUF2007 domain-containing protein [Bacillota bacterium]HOH11033.1 DUF2007 domain-containing protein [Bacillota bacterium]HOY88276.1 DUF2007 domain-containing protein [Bacillota bacterium]HPI01429.1 DUF2007 domain-containing protein [Bacillota bacterium]HPM64287.1 DUF2007 domain-containing protein [Bacillota bacterium]
MWVVIHLAPNKMEAEILKSVLEAENILVRLRPASIPHLGDLGPFDVMVLESELEYAREVLEGKEDII